jgi:hypothetical protein
MSKHEYKIVILLPTRGRTDALERSVKSIFSTADDPKSIQIRFAFDDDDEIGFGYFTKKLQPWMDKQGINYEAMQFAPMTYGGLNVYYNTLAEGVSTDWFFVWNDDAIMDTKGWDTVVNSYTGQFRLLKLHTHNEHPYSIFPIIPSEWYDTIGYFSRHQMIDAELSQIAYMLDLMEIIDVSCEHDRADLTGNNADETDKVRVRYEGNPNDPRDFHNVNMGRGRQNDALRLEAYMKENGIDTSFWENVKVGKQDPWVKLKANDPNGQMVTRTMVQA